MQLLRRVCWLALAMGFLSAGFVFATSQVKILNFRDWPRALEAVTGISSYSSEIARFYENNYTQFPKMGELSEVTTSFLVANTSYTSWYCKRMIEEDSQKEPASRWAHFDVDFKAAPSTLPLDEVITEYADIFWLGEINPAEKKILVEAVEAIRGGFPDDPKHNVDVLMSGCVLFLNSLKFTLK